VRALRPTKLLALACGTLSGAALFAIMVLTFFDVGGRKLLDNSIPGSLELTELLMVVVIFGALPLVSLRGEHVLFDSLDASLPPRVLRLQKALIDLLIAVALIALAVLMWNTAGDFGATGETTAQLQVPKAPFLYGMAVLCALAGLVHVGLMLRPPAPLAEGEGVAL
jgi:TRAP-type C4-dicarboxylate transport system permease small subunit